MSPSLASAMSDSCPGILAWCVVCGVHPAASVRIRLGKLPPSCLLVRPPVVAPPAVRFCICPGAAPCDYSCFCTCPPLCAGARWPMPTWVYFFFILFSDCPVVHFCVRCPSNRGYHAPRYVSTLLQTCSTQTRQDTSVIKAWACKMQPGWKILRFLCRWPACVRHCCKWHLSLS